LYTENYHVSDDYGVIAEMEFRLNSDKYNYVRIVFSFYEWIGSIGGGLFVIKAFFSYIMGDLLLFNCKIECMSELYTNEKTNKE
jgi:hypothetical protein